MSAFRGVTSDIEFEADLSSTGSNIASLSGVATVVDGVTATAGMRVFLKDQSTGSQNGLWIVASGAWVRPPWFGGTGHVIQQVPPGHIVKVTQGSTQAGMTWVNTNTSAITPDTTALTYKRFDGAWDEWETLITANGIVPSSQVGATLLMRQDGAAMVASSAALSGGSLIFGLDPANYAVPGKTLQVRVVGHAITDTPAPGVSFVYGLWSVTSTSSMVLTVAGAASITATITTPAANTMTQAYSAALTMPAAGTYFLSCAFSGTQSAKATFHHSLLQLRAI